MDPAATYDDQADTEVSGIRRRFADTAVVNYEGQTKRIIGYDYCVPDLFALSEELPPPRMPRRFKRTAPPSPVDTVPRPSSVRLLKSTPIG